MDQQGRIKAKPETFKTMETLESLIVPNPQLCVQVVVGFPLEANQA